jgi:hypothetical protein
MGRSGRGLWKSTIQRILWNPSARIVGLNSLTWELVNCVTTEQSRFTRTKHLTHTHTFSCPNAQTPSHENMCRNAGEAPYIHKLCSFILRQLYPKCPWELGGPQSRYGGDGRGENPYSCRVSVISLSPGTLLTTQAYTHTDFICHYSDTICLRDAVITHYNLYKVVALQCFQPLIL